jgi:ATP-dependent RNA helicase DDX51/DBP6
MLILPPALKPLNLIYLVHHPEHKVRGALVFAKSVESAARLVKLLEFFEEAWVEEKVVVRGYTSEMKPAERKRLLGEFAEGEVHL